MAGGHENWLIIFNGTGEGMNWKCLLGQHKWSKVGGASNMGHGKFRVRARCVKCGKHKDFIS